MTFGEKLQSLRQRAGMSQDVLAERLQVSRQAVSRWERDETMPGTDKRFLDFAKRKWYLLGWVLIAWGVLDLVQLAIFYLAYRGLLGGFTGLLGW